MNLAEDSQFLGLLSKTPSDAFPSNYWNYIRIHKEIPDVHDRFTFLDDGKRIIEDDLNSILDYAILYYE